MQFESIQELKTPSTIVTCKNSQISIKCPSFHTVRKKEESIKFDSLSQALDSEASNHVHKASSSQSSIS